MAYVGRPWHGLGNELTPQQPIEVWAEQSGMSFQILETPVRFMAESAGPLGSIKTFADQKVLYRSDTQDARRSSPIVTKSSSPAKCWSSTVTHASRRL
jgi:hypothetical protein